MEPISRSLLTFLLNSLWQIPLVTAVAALGCRTMRNSPASYRHAVWVSALLASMVLPLASIHPRDTSTNLEIAIPIATQNFAMAQAAPGRPSALPVARKAASVPRSVSFAGTTANILVGTYLLFLVFGLARLARASMRTVQIRRSAQPDALPPPVEDVWTRCRTAFDLSGVQLLSSGQISGPVAAGRSIILPGSFMLENSEDVLTTAIGHEMAHIVRRDFSLRILYEALYLPVRFHPASTGLPCVVLPLSNPQALGLAQVDHRAYKAWLADVGPGNIAAFCRGSGDPACALSMRVFVDDSGFSEDPATGSAAGNLAGYCIAHGVFGSGRLSATFAQGDHMGRPSRLFVEAKREAGHICVRVGGEVVPVAEGSWPI